MIGQRIHPVTHQVISYVACIPAADEHVRVAAPAELAEVRWLRRDQIEDHKPGLHDQGRDHLADHW